ncbi:MAG TPA: hypothetical protein VGK16_11620 [Candidatus Limnocylindrales bacterium]
MPLVEKPVQLPASPTDDRDGIRADRGEDPAQRPAGHGPSATTLDRGHELLADARALRHVGLAQTRSPAERPEDGANLSIVHVLIVTQGAHRRLIRLLTPSYQPGECKHPGAADRPSRTSARGRWYRTRPVAPARTR